MKRTTAAIFVAVFIMIAIGAAIALSVTFRSESPFDGARSIDLGAKAMVNGEATWTGAFKLHNVSGTSVHVLALRPSCRCLDVELPRRVVPAGETLEIPFTITLDKPGERTVYIDLVLPEERIEELQLRAVAE